MYWRSIVVYRRAASKTQTTGEGAYLERAVTKATLILQQIVAEKTGRG